MGLLATRASLSFLVKSTTTFGVRRDAVISRALTTGSTGFGGKDIPRLTEHNTQLLDDVDAFIFDCDGVIWKVK